MGKGFSGRKQTRKSHITVALREARAGKKSASTAVFGPIGRGRQAPRGGDFHARVVPALMAVLVLGSPSRQPLAGGGRDSQGRRP